MKICPGCKRYYADDTQVFCLEDGVQLDFVADPNATIQMPAVRDTDPPATLVLPPDQVPGGSGSGTWPAQPGMEVPSDQTRLAGGPVSPTVPAGTVPASPPYGAGQMHIPVAGPAAPVAPAPAKKNTALIATVVVLVVAVLGLGSVLGYMWLNSDTKTAGTGGGSTPSGSTPNSNNSNTAGNNNSNTGGGSGNTNSGDGGASNTNTGNSNTGGGNDSAWLQGSFSGDGIQYDGGKWTFTYVNTDGTPKIEYPSVRCGGRWDTVSVKSNEAVFNEIITHGKNCISNGRVVVVPNSDGSLDVKWYYVGDIVGASATLRRE